MKKILIYLNKYYWNIIYIIYLINKFVEFPLILITYNILLFIYIKIIKKKNITKNILLLTIILIISLLIKKIIKKIIFINRPYINILNNIKKYKNIKKYYNIPIWLIKHWKKKKDSSFPSGHTIFCNFWIIIFKKKKKWYIYIIKKIFIIIIISRLLLYLHRIEDIIFSIIINIIINKIFFIY